MEKFITAAASSRKRHNTAFRFAFRCLFHSPTADHRLLRQSTPETPCQASEGRVFSGAGDTGASTGSSKKRGFSRRSIAEVSRAVVAASRQHETVVGPAPAGSPRCTANTGGGAWRHPAKERSIGPARSAASVSSSVHAERRSRQSESRQTEWVAMI